MALDIDWTMKLNDLYCSSLPHCRRQIMDVCGIILQVLLTRVPLRPHPACLSSGDGVPRFCCRKVSTRPASRTGMVHCVSSVKVNSSESFSLVIQRTAQTMLCLLNCVLSIVEANPHTSLDYSSLSVPVFPDLAQESSACLGCNTFGVFGGGLLSKGRQPRGADGERSGVCHG